MSSQMYELAPRGYTPAELAPKQGYEGQKDGLETLHMLGYSSASLDVSDEASKSRNGSYRDPYESISVQYDSSYEVFKARGDPEKPLLPSSKAGFTLGTFERSSTTSAVWTRPAQVFMLSISLFVVTTIALLIPLEIYNAREWAPRLSDNIYSSGRQRGSPSVLQPQAIASELFLLVVAYFAVRSRNMIHIIAVLCFNVFLVVSGFLEAGLRNAALSERISSDQEENASNSLPLVWAIPIVDLLFHLGCDWAAWKLYRELGWYAYKKVSGDLRLRQLYQHYLVLSSLLLFTGCFSIMQTWSVGYVAIWDTKERESKEWYDAFWKSPDYYGADGAYGLERYDREHYQLRAKALKLIAVFVALSILYLVGLVLTLLAVRRERRVLLFVGAGLQICYIAWNIGQIVLFARVVKSNVALYLHNSAFLPIRTIFQIIVGFNLAVATLVYTILVGRGFGNGLKEIYPTAAILRSEQIDLSID